MSARKTVLVATCVLGWAALGCGDESSNFNNPEGGLRDGDPIFNGFGDAKGDGKECVGLCPQIKNCGSAPKTSISGKIYDPAGKVPLYNVVVYVPNAPIAPMTSGASCDKCGATLSGNPLVVTTTNSKGEFKLEDMPGGKDIPVVIQVGKWRRQITLPQVNDCVDNPLTDKNLTRLPKNQSEGNIPLIALTTGGADPLECLPRKMGIDDAEFTSGTGTGRIQLYKGTNGGQAAGSTGAQAFWSDVNALKKYDIVLLACEGQTYPATKPAAALQALYDYAGVGGRVFATHYHYYWLETGVAEFPTTATWAHSTIPNPSTGFIDTSFPKGVAFADWMLNVNGSTTLGQFPINEPRRDASKHNPATSVRWVYNTPLDVLFYYSFNTPVSATPDKQCGKVVYSDLHVSSGDTVGQTFPTGCKTTDLSPQEKALEFLLFDLSSCIQDDTKPIVLPN